MAAHYGQAIVIGPRSVWRAEGTATKPRDVHTFGKWPGDLPGLLLCRTVGVLVLAARRAGAIERRRIRALGNQLLFGLVLAVGVDLRHLRLERLQLLAG